MQIHSKVGIWHNYAYQHWCIILDYNALREQDREINFLHYQAPD